MLALALDPSPQRLIGGGLLSHHAYEFPLLQFVDGTAVTAKARIRHSQSHEQSQQSSVHLPSRQQLDLGEVWFVHARRHQKAREQKLFEQRGSLDKAYARLRESRELRASPL